MECQNKVCLMLERDAAARSVWVRALRFTTQLVREPGFRLNRMAKSASFPPVLSLSLRNCVLARPL